MGPNVSLRQMRYFVAVAEERNFRLAAERLHITQPPLSRQIAELEGALGVTLLLREPRQVRLTAAGARALEEFRHVLAAAWQAFERIGALRDALPRLRLGLPGWLDLKGLPALEQALQRRGLVAEVESRLLPGHEAEAALRAGRLDAALLAGPLDPAGLALVPLAELRMAALLPAASPLARRRAVALSDLDTLPPFYRFRRSLSPALWDHFDRQYRAHGFQPRQEAPAPEVMEVLARIGAGRGCTCVPVPLAVHRYAGVVRRTLKERVTMQLVLAMAPALPAPLPAALTDAAAQLVPRGAEPVSGGAPASGPSGRAGRHPAGSAPAR